MENWSDAIAFSKLNKFPPPNGLEINKPTKGGLLEDLQYVISQRNWTDMWNLEK